MTYSIVLPPFRLWGCGRAASASLFFLGIVLSPGIAAAQVVNPTTVAPSAQPITSGGVGVTAPAVEVPRAPANADKIFLTVRGVEVEDGFPELQEQTATLIGEIQGRRISVAKLYEFADALQLAYVNAGYPLVHVRIPHQNVQSGSIRIVVIDGIFEDIDLSAVPERARNLVRARLEPLIGKKHVTTAELQRRVLLIGDIAGVVGSSEIKAGSAGGTILVIKATEKPVSTATAASNRLPKELGTWEFTQAVDVNNALGWGEQFYANTRSGSDVDRFFDGTSMFMAYGGGVVVPIGSDGLRMEASYASVRQRPKHTFGVFPFEEELEGEWTAAKYERASVAALYPIILTLEQSVRVQATYDHTVSFQRLGPSPLIGSLLFPLWPVYYGLSNDRYDAVRAAADWSVQFPWSWGGNATTTAIYSHGLGGRTAWDSPIVGTPLSRPGASPNFNKFYIDMVIRQPLPEEFQVSFVARAMTSFGAPLMLPEELSLDGANALSGFAAGTLNVDRGVTLRSELSHPFTIGQETLQTLNTAAPGIIQNAVTVPYIFGAWGTGVHEWPFYNPFYVAEVKTIGAESLGGGIRADINILAAPFSESLAIECAKEFSNIPFRSSGYRTNFSFAVRF
jgi:hemolysin activation/secretion protein